MSADERGRRRSAAEEEASDRSDDSLIPYSWPGWGVWSPMTPWRGDDRTDAAPGERPAEPAETDEGSLWDEGLYTTLIVVGAVLILFPEPATSGIGVLLALAGAIGWIYDALT